MEDEGTRPSSPPPAASAALSVLGNDDLLRGILLSLDFPTTLVRASLVCRRWLRHASDPAFLRRFRARNPPRLLGFYHTAHRDEQPEFVPLPQPPELAPVLRRGGFRLGGASGTDSAVVFDSRNGRVLRAEFPPPPHEVRFGVFTPLHPGRQPPDLPPALHSQLYQRGVEVPHDAWMLLPGFMLLPEDGGDDLSYTLVVLIRNSCELFARAVSVRDGNNGGDWELVDTMSLHQSFGQVVKPDWESGDPSLGDAFVSLHRVEDNAELFLIVDRVIFHIHIANKTAYKVFQMTPKDDIGFGIYPFMMLWPPTFPALNYDHDQYE
ncbi:hypothetical protein E2562_010325 [Oryza meyeriana var. granulata]|uniref:Uncharacterized protein n=1 Tax=Oryza meyeriana var. granulata TaxID=110450 RepID=A0A6G1F691_9ORYZ|nr:hypothetical protein E2562_010325 [Oryza meyeriana var. granulata]